MVKSFKTNILTWLKTKTYIKTEIDELLQLKSNIGHTHTNASTTTPGFLSAEDKTKLNNLEQITVDSTINATSTNPVQNKVINTALTGKANTNHTHGITNITNLQSQLDGKANSVHTHDDRYYTETEMNTKLNGKANSSHSHSINDVTGLSTSLDGKMNNDYSESTIESNFFAHKIGNIVIVTWWGGTLPTTQKSWVDWKTLPYQSCNTQPIWVDGNGDGCEVRVRVPPNSNKLQVNINGGTGGIRPGMIVYPTK